ncbi:hypothetical protein ETK16_09635 [Salmonella enterica]|nr:hypothetical protein [Salmonella enterica]
MRVVRGVTPKSAPRAPFPDICGISAPTCKKVSNGAGFATARHFSRCAGLAGVIEMRGKCAKCANKDNQECKP